MSTDDTRDFVLFQQEIDDALALATTGDVKYVSEKCNQLASKNADLELDLIDAQSLLDRCVQISEEYAPPSLVIRSIHHFACTGGSLISKCLHAMPGAHVISEVHPLARQHVDIRKQKFTPTDTITAAFYAGVPRMDELALKIFEKDVLLILEQAERYGFLPIFREHSHTDYCVGEAPLAAQPMQFGALANAKHKRLVTVRDPVDSYASLTSNGWLDHQPPTFDEYCNRYLKFLESFDETEIFYYEDFVLSPAREMTKMCAHLDIPYSGFFEQVFDVRSISGDSGRRSSTISARSSRKFDTALRQELESSVTYAKLRQFLNMSIRPNEFTTSHGFERA